VSAPRRVARRAVAVVAAGAVAVTAAPAAHALHRGAGDRAFIVQQDPVPTFEEGQVRRALVAARNDTAVSWEASGPSPVRLGTKCPQDRHSAFFNADSDPLRAWISTNRAASVQPALVTPGAVGTFEFWPKAPNLPPGVVEKGYQEYFAAVQEGVHWMGLECDWYWIFNVERREAPRVDSVIPAARVGLGADVPVDVETSDNVGLARVEYRVDGELLRTDPGLGQEDGSDRERYAERRSLATARLAPGPHEVMVTARDVVGQTDSRAASFVVNAPPVGAIAPVDGATDCADVQLDGRPSHDPDGNTLAYAWDLDLSDGRAYDDSSDAMPVRRFAAGVTTVAVRVTDADGDTDTTERDVAVAPCDREAPVPTAFTRPAPNPAGWSRGNDVRVELTASDQPSGGAGVCRIEHRRSADDDWTAVDGSAATVRVDAEGHHMLRFRATDCAGHVEDQRTHAVSLDRSPPSVAIDEPASGIGTVDAIAGSVDDVLAGVASLPRVSAISAVDALLGGRPTALPVECVVGCVPGSAKLRWRASARALLPGSYTVTAIGADAAGNEAAATRSLLVLGSGGLLPQR
jgi:hypothetical protein